MRHPAAPEDEDEADAACKNWAEMREIEISSCNIDEETEGEGRVEAAFAACCSK